MLSRIQSTAFIVTLRSYQGITGERRKEEPKKVFAPPSSVLLFASWYRCSVTVNGVGASYFAKAYNRSTTWRDRNGSTHVCPRNRGCRHSRQPTARSIAGRQRRTGIDRRQRRGQQLHGRAVPRLPQLDQA